MKATILGSSGSMGQPGNPASGYLLSFDNAPSVLMDIGPGVLARLQEVQDPCDAHVVFSHLHADHCLDFPGLLVWRRFHPEAPAKGRNFCLGPADAPVHLGRISADSLDEVDDMSDTFAFSAWRKGHTELVDACTITPFPVIHPIETYALRVEDNHTGKVLAYSGDSAYTDELVTCARGAEVFLCEATWGDTSEGKAPNMHMSGEEAGRIARLAGVKLLVLVHIPPWGDPDEAIAAARREFDGEIRFGAPGLELSL